MTLEEILYNRIKEQQLYSRDVRPQTVMKDLEFDEYDMYDIMSEIGAMLGVEVTFEEAKSHVNSTFDEVLKFMTRRILEKGADR